MLVSQSQVDGQCFLISRSRFDSLSQPFADQADEDQCCGLAGAAIQPLCHLPALFGINKRRLRLITQIAQPCTR